MIQDVIIMGKAIILQMYLPFISTGLSIKAMCGFTFGSGPSVVFPTPKDIYCFQHRKVRYSSNTFDLLRKVRYCKSKSSV